MTTALTALESPVETLELSKLVAQFEGLTAEQRIQWALNRFRPEIMFSTGFGGQSAAALHMVSQHWPEIPVVLIDTGYLFPETYQFTYELIERLKLNLKIYRPDPSPAVREARESKLWEQGAEGLQCYNQIHRVEPMQRAIRELGARACFTGLRREDKVSCAGLRALDLQESIVKIHPLMEWTDRQVKRYMEKHDLPHHPLWGKVHGCIGDVHSTRRVAEM